MEKPRNEATWNKKRIFAGLLLLLIVALAVGGYFFKTRVLGENLREPTKIVKGINTKEKDTGPELKINVQEAVKEKIDSIKQQVLGLNIAEIASSSPQVQKIISDIKSLEQYPTNQVKEICRKICGL